MRKVENSKMYLRRKTTCFFKKKFSTHFYLRLKKRREKKIFFLVLYKWNTYFCVWFKQIGGIWRQSPDRQFGERGARKGGFLRLKKRREKSFCIGCYLMESPDRQFGEIGGPPEGRLKRGLTVWQMWPTNEEKWCYFFRCLSLSKRSINEKVSNGNSSTLASIYNPPLILLKR